MSLSSPCPTQYISHSSLSICTKNCNIVTINVAHTFFNIRMEKKVSCATTLVSQINYLDKNNKNNTQQHKTRDMTQFDRNIAKKAKAENIYTLVNNNVIDTILRAVIKIEKKIVPRGKFSLSTNIYLTFVCKLFVVVVASFVIQCCVFIISAMYFRAQNNAFMHFFNKQRICSSCKVTETLRSSNYYYYFYVIIVSKCYY